MKALCAKDDHVRLNAVTALYPILTKESAPRITSLLINHLISDNSISIRIVLAGSARPISLPV